MLQHHCAPFFDQVHLFELVLVVLLDPLVQLGAVKLQRGDLAGLLLDLQDHVSAGGKLAKIGPQKRSMRGEREVDFTV